MVHESHCYIRPIGLLYLPFMLSLFKGRAKYDVGNCKLIKFMVL